MCACMRIRARNFSERCVCWCTECIWHSHILARDGMLHFCAATDIECFALLKTDLCRPEVPALNPVPYCLSITHRRRIQCGHCVDRNFDSLRRSMTCFTCRASRYVRTYRIHTYRSGDFDASMLDCYFRKKRSRDIREITIAASAIAFHNQTCNSAYVYNFLSYFDFQLEFHYIFLH